MALGFTGFRGTVELVVAIHSEWLPTPSPKMLLMYPPPSLHGIPIMQEVKLGPCIIPDEPVGKYVLENVAVIKDPDGYKFEVNCFYQPARRFGVSCV